MYAWSPRRIDSVSLRDTVDLRGKGQTTVYAEDQLLPISALQHLLYCERQCALIHLEQAWSENRFTAEGRNLHEHVHAGGSESRGDTRTAKLANGRTVLQRSLRDHSETDADGLTAQAVAKLGHTLGTLAIISDPVGSLLHAQALLLARHLRGDLDAYPPFIWK